MNTAQRVENFMFVGRETVTFKPWILSPAVYICVHSAHATFTGAPLLQRSLLWGQTWWDKYTWWAPSSNTINDIHDHPGDGDQSGDLTDS